MKKNSDLRIERGKQTRQTILEAAYQLLVEEGPAGITASKVAAKANISKANLFHHFNRIDEIPFAVLEEIFGQAPTMEISKKAKSVADYINLIGKSLIDAPEEQKKAAAAFVQFYMRSAHDEAFRAQQEKITAKFMLTMTKAFEDLLGRPLKTKERDVAPLLVASCLEGMGLLLITFRDPERFQKMWTSFAQLVGQYLGEGD